MKQREDRRVSTFLTQFAPDVLGLPLPEPLRDERPFGAFYLPAALDDAVFQCWFYEQDSHRREVILERIVECEWQRVAGTPDGLQWCSQLSTSFRDSRYVTDAATVQRVPSSWPVSFIRWGMISVLAAGTLFSIFAGSLGSTRDRTAPNLPPVVNQSARGIDELDAGVAVAGLGFDDAVPVEPTVSVNQASERLASDTENTQDATVPAEHGGDQWWKPAILQIVRPTADEGTGLYASPSDIGGALARAYPTDSFVLDSSTTQTNSGALLPVRPLSARGSLQAYLRDYERKGGAGPYYLRAGAVSLVPSDQASQAGLVAATRNVDAPLLETPSRTSRVLEQMSVGQSASLSDAIVGTQDGYFVKLDVGTVSGYVPADLLMILSAHR
jgi:hypothetical protein